MIKFNLLFTILTVEQNNFTTMNPDDRKLYKKSGGFCSKMISETSIFFLTKIAIIEKYRNVVKYATQKTLNSILECTGVKLICPDYYKSFDRRTYLTRDQKAVFHFKKLLTI